MEELKLKISKPDDRTNQLLCLAIIQQLYWLLKAKGTGDDGDSITHFLYSKFAFVYPSLFLSHWGKPVFITLSAPFCQFGFVGMSLFNSITTILTAHFTYKLAKKLELKNSEFVILILVCMPEYLRLSISGLTEHLFALLTIITFYLLTCRRVIYAILLASLLPFSRPEGYFIIGIVGVYTAFSKENYKYLPLLSIGHIFYSFLGRFIYDKDWLWVFKSNPNAELITTYGRTGDWLHYIIKILEIVGLPIYIIFILGILVFFFKTLVLKRRDTYLTLSISAMFLTIAAHTVFWKFGIFKSFGLKRNLLTIAPLIALTALNWI